MLMCLVFLSLDFLALYGILKVKPVSFLECSDMPFVWVVCNKNILDLKKLWRVAVYFILINGNTGSTLEAE